MLYDHFGLDCFYFTQHSFICRPQIPLCRKMLGLNQDCCVEALGMSGYESVVEAVIVLKEAVRVLKEAVRECP